MSSCSQENAGDRGATNLHIYRSDKGVELYLSHFKALRDYIDVFEGKNLKM